MIGASRRHSRVGRQTGGSTFELHLREARAASAHRRLLHGALAALAVSVVTLFVPWQLPVRALVVVLAGIAGAAWPLRRGVEGALRSIRGQTGLSYETALTVLNREGGASSQQEGQPDPDPYGLGAAVIDRARESVRSYASEPRPAWWLPALVVAASLVLLPEILTLPASTSTAAALGAVGVGGEAAPEAEGVQSEPAPPEPPAPGRAEEPAMSPDRNDDDSGSPVTELPEGDMEGQAPLDRYLQSLRERPAATGASTDGAEGENDSPEADQQSEDDRSREPGDGQETRDGERTNESSQDASGSGDTPPEGDDQGESESQEGTEESGAEAVGAEGSPIREQDPEAQPGGDRVDEGDTGSGEDPAGENSVDQGGSGDPASGSEGTDSAGVGGAEGAEELLDPQGAGGSQEQLSGVLQDGPETVAGSVRIPGSDDVDLPPGTDLAPYRSAAEEALTEGDLPLDYQEIIRRYFR